MSSKLAPGWVDQVAKEQASAAHSAPQPRDGRPEGTPTRSFKRRSGSAQLMAESRSRGGKKPRKMKGLPELKFPEDDL